MAASHSALWSIWPAPFPVPVLPPPCPRGAEWSRATAEAAGLLRTESDNPCLTGQAKSWRMEKSVEKNQVPHERQGSPLGAKLIGETSRKAIPSTGCYLKTLSNFTCSKVSRLMSSLPSSVVSGPSELFSKSLMSSFFLLLSFFLNV